ncbi:MAG TPA: DUF882 domain-containing protein [Kaistia sp.]|nr:DUF882 domain-containing protein [Kaistia sp.]
MASTVRVATASALVAGTMLVTARIGEADAAAGDRALTLVNVHTNEGGTIVFKRNGRYDPEGLKRLNWVLRDWRKNQPTNMDPHLFDLIWQVYQQSGSRVPIKVVCGYRSPETNGMLRSRSRGVAKHSQHMLGKAMDFYIPDVALPKLRAIGLKMQIGGVGFYPTSGSPFVHMDTGSVRHWPKMTREQLVRIFPDGKTLHIPSDGKPLPGYAEALAAYNARKANGGDAIVMASASGGGGGKSFLQRIFGGGADEEEDNAESTVNVKASGKAAPAAGDDDSDAPVTTAKDAPKTAPEAAPDSDAAPMLVAMAPVPRPSPIPQAAAAAEPTIVAEADAAATETEVAMAPVPRPSPVEHQAPTDEPIAVVADASEALPVPRTSPVARPAVTLASAASSGAVSGHAVAAQLAALNAPAAPEQVAMAVAPAAHQPATAAEAIAEAVGKGNAMGTAPVLAYASAADEGAPRIDARTGALVAGRAAAPDVTAANVESNDDWQDPLARFTAVGYDAGTIELVTRPGSTRQKAYAEMEMPHPFGQPALFTAPQRSIQLGFGRIAYEGLRTDRFSGPMVRPVGTLVFASNDYKQTVSLKR